MHEQLSLDKPLDYELYDVAVDPEHVRDINEIGALALKDTVNLNYSFNTTSIDLYGFQVDATPAPTSFAKDTAETATSKFNQSLPALEDGPNTSTLSEYGMSFDEMQNLKADLHEKSAGLYEKLTAEHVARQKQQIQDDIAFDIIDTQRQHAIQRANKKKNTWAQNGHI